MNKKGIITQLVIEIVAMVLTISFTIPLWNSIDTSEESSIARYYDNYYYVDYKVNKINDIDHVTLNNNSNTLEEYMLVMKIKDNKLLNLNDVTVKVNNEDKSLGEFETITKGAYKYIVLDKSSIVANTTSYDILVSDDNITSYTIEVMESI